MNYKIILRVDWDSNESVCTPRKVIITLTEEQIERILRYIEYSTIEGVIVCMPHSNIEYVMDEDDTDLFRSDVHNIRIMGNTCYFHAQSKYDSSIQIESQPFYVSPKSKRYLIEYVYP
jgi:hypothetical protein